MLDHLLSSFSHLLDDSLTTFPNASPVAKLPIVGTNLPNIRDCRSVAQTRSETRVVDSSISRLGKDLVDDLAKSLGEFLNERDAVEEQAALHSVFEVHLRVAGTRTVNEGVTAALPCGGA